MDASYNERFDLKSDSKGFASKSARTKVLNIDVTFKEPQQIAGFVFKKSTNK